MSHELSKVPSPSEICICLRAQGILTPDSFCHIAHDALDLATTFKKISCFEERLLISKMMLCSWPWTIFKATVPGCFCVYRVCKMLLATDCRYRFQCHRNRLREWSKQSWKMHDCTNFPIAFSQNTLKGKLQSLFLR